MEKSDHPLIWLEALNTALQYICINYAPLRFDRVIPDTAMSEDDIMGTRADLRLGIDLKVTGKYCNKRHTKVRLYYTGLHTMQPAISSTHHRHKTVLRRPYTRFSVRLIDTLAENVNWLYMF